MGDFDYLLFGFGMTLLVLVLNLAGFIALPFVAWKVAQHISSRAKT